MAGIRRLVLDVLKPHEPSISKFAHRTEKIGGVEGVNASVIEIDEDVENIKITVEGENIDEAEVRDEIEGLGGSIHSIDEIVCGEKKVEQVETMQDR
jgi:hypothetical protein